MKQICAMLCLLTATTVSAGKAKIGKWHNPETIKANDGVMNGPLMKTNYNIQNEGTKKSLEMAIKDLMATCGGKYPKGAEYLNRLAAIKDHNDPAFAKLKKEALLANPLLSFDKILMVESKKGIRFTSNWQSRTSGPAEMGSFSDAALNKAISKVAKKDEKLKELQDAVNKEKKAISKPSKRDKRSKAEKQKDYEAAIKKRNDYAKRNKKLAGLIRSHEKFQNGHKEANFDNTLSILSIKTGKVTPIYHADKFIGEVDLHCDGNKVLFTSHGPQKSNKGLPSYAKGYEVFELEFDPATGKAKGEPRQAVPDMGADVDNYDACYLPDDKIIFASTASYTGVPCVSGSSFVANLYRINKDGSDLRRLTFDQENNWSPTLMENGRVMFTRWEYTDSAHYFSRILMTMNPDGTDQKAFYGSNSYWPNSMFHSRQIPGKSTMFVSTICGHHDNKKDGAIGLFDVSKGRFEADGAIQLLGQRGKPVLPLVIDNLAKMSYNVTFNHPFPLSDKYFLANKQSEIYLIDVFDNMLKLGEGYEPMPLRKTKRANIIPDRTDRSKTYATVMINDIYEGPGLAGVPRGTVKAIRVYRYEYAPRHQGGHYALAMEGGWDTRQIIGTAPVEADGSANFTIPANAPFSMQPLDKDGRALAIMRSWTVAMPGEILACVGCHESQNMAPPVKRYKAMMRRPSAPKQFYGPMRGFAFEREVYKPVIRKYCIGCHDGKTNLDSKGRDKAGRYTVPNRVTGAGKNPGKKFIEVGIPSFADSKSAYNAIHPFIRRNGPEGDYHLLTPLEFHASTSELFQMLEKGHHNVKLDAEAKDRLITWADLNVPQTGTWMERKGADVLNRRLELARIYGGVGYNPEAVIDLNNARVKVVMPEKVKPNVVKASATRVSGRAGSAGELDLGNGVKMKLVSIPAGEFSMGSNSETPVEQPVSRVRIEKPFSMGATEVSLRQYRQFDPDYLNGVYDMHFKDQVHRGYYMNDVDFPVIRVSWKKALEFCAWLSKKTGKRVTLPTESEWEWACRAGTMSSFSYGDLDTDFSKYANLSDLKAKELAVSGVNPRPIPNPKPDRDFEPKDPRFNDKVLHLAEVGSFAPNKWGLYDMHGNVAEWTLSAYKPYPYNDNDGRNEIGAGRKVVRGGSWHDRPFRSSSSFRLGYEDWHRVYNVGFRVVVK